MAFFNSEKYTPIVPEPDSEKFEGKKRLILRHGIRKESETEIFFVDDKELYSGWVIGIID